jgi:multiple sugar transport system substrate-binding protein
MKTSHLRRWRASGAILALIVAAGCGTSATNSPSSLASDGGGTPSGTEAAGGQLQFAIFGGGGAHLDAILAELDAFGAAHPEISVDVTQDSFYSRPVPYAKLQERYFEEAPDLVSGFIGGSLTADAEAGRFLDLTDLWAELGLEEAVPASVAELSSVDGHRYWVPTIAQWNPVFYNTEAFAAADVTPPRTWDELLAACGALRAAGSERPIGQAGTASWTPPAARWFSTLDLLLNGPEFHRRLARGEVAWTDERVTAVFDHWQQLFDEGCYGEPALQAYSDPISQLSDGRAAMDNLGEWIFESALLSDDDPIDFFSLAPISEGLPQAEIVLVYGLAIPAAAADPEGAKELLRWLVSSAALERTYASVPRVILDRRVDPGYLQRHRDGLQLFEEADRLVELWEFSAPSPQAEIGLDLFTSYLADPSDLDGYLQTAEMARADAFGPATE